MSDLIDYTAMNAPELLQACGDDGTKWAAAFCQHAVKQGHVGLDEHWVFGWFANAIERSNDERRWRRERAEPALAARAREGGAP